MYLLKLLNKNYVTLLRVFESIGILNKLECPNFKYMYIQFFKKCPQICVEYNLYMNVFIISCLMQYILYTTV